MLETHIHGWQQFPALGPFVAPVDYGYYHHTHEAGEDHAHPQLGVLEELIFRKTLEYPPAPNLEGMSILDGRQW